MSFVDKLYNLNPWWEGKKSDTPDFKRWYFYLLMEKLRDPNLRDAIMLIGLRRTGKTVLTHQLANELMDDWNVLYISVDLLLLDTRNPILESIRYFEDNVEERGKQSLVIIDEAQYYERWSDVVKGLLDVWRMKGAKRALIVTGSSSIGLLMGAEESLVGRSEIYRLYPMGLAEITGLEERDNRYSKFIFRMWKNILTGMFTGKPLDVSSEFRGYSKLRRALKLMMRYGGLPEIISLKIEGKADDEITKRVLEIIDLIILRDVLKLQKRVSSSYELDPDEAEKIFSIIAYRSPYLATINGISKDSSVHWGKVDLALKLFKTSGVIGLAKNYAKDPSVIARKRLMKIFVSDISFRNSVRLRLGRALLSSEEQGAILENLTLSQALKISHLAGDPNPKIFFWRMNNMEMDVVVPSQFGVLGIEVKRGKKRERWWNAFQQYENRAKRLKISLDEEDYLLNYFLL